MAGLAILKYTFDLSDDAVCERWVESPYFQYFCGEEFFCHELPLDRSSLTRWRQRMGEARILALLQESLAVAVKTGAMQPEDTRRVIVDTTVQPKNVMFPTDAKLINRAREKLVKLAGKLGLHLRQSYRRVGKLALIRHQRYAHAHQFKRANKALRKLKTYLGRTIRDIARQIAGEDELQAIFLRPLHLAGRVLEDIVAKRFFTSRCATLIQEMDPSRKIDSNDALIGFESCSLGGERRLLQQYRHNSDVTTIATDD
jgi:IS5 family transposase